MNIQVQCFSKNPTVMQSGPDTIKQSWFTFSSFLIVFGVTGILCSFRLVLEANANKGTLQSSRLEFSQKISANDFTLSDTEDNNLRTTKRKKNTYLHLLPALSKIFASD